MAPVWTITAVIKREHCLQKARSAIQLNWQHWNLSTPISEWRVIWWQLSDKLCGVGRNDGTCPWSVTDALTLLAKRSHLDWMEPQCTYFTNQVFTDHGRFGAYLHRLDKTETPERFLCDHSLNDMVLTIFVYNVCKKKRWKLYIRIGEELTIANRTPTNKEVWTTIVA